MQFSLTQAGNIVVLLGFVLNLAGIRISTEEITKFVESGLVLIGLVVSWYGRYRIGDLTLWGTRRD